MFTGGIGIAPLHSMLQERLDVCACHTTSTISSIRSNDTTEDVKLIPRTHLMYSISSPEEFLFGESLTAMVAQHQPSTFDTTVYMSQHGVKASPPKKTTHQDTEEQVNAPDQCMAVTEADSLQDFPIVPRRINGTEFLHHVTLVTLPIDLSTSTSTSVYIYRYRLNMSTFIFISRFSRHCWTRETTRLSWMASALLKVPLN